MTNLLARIIIIIFSFSASANAVELHSITSSELNVIANDNTELKLFFFFTSWCGVCKENLADLFVLRQQYKNNPKVRIIAISIDDNPYLINTFVKKLPKTINDKVFHFNSADSYSVLKMFQELKVRYTGSIPYVILFDKSGKVLADGNFKISGFSVGIDKLLERR